MSPTLVLNATYEPLCVVPLKRAVLLVLKEKAEVVHEADGEFRSAQTSVPIPSVIRLTKFVRVPRRVKARLTNRAVLTRDNHTCQYCGAKGDTVDHVVPRARGGQHRWENVVAACRPCNGRKSDKTLEQIGWKLAKKPVAPHETHWIVIGVAKIDPAWEVYLGYSRAEVVPAF